MKNLLKIAPLVLIIVLLLAIKLGGCQLFPNLPSETTLSSDTSSTTAGPTTNTTSASETTATTAPTTAATTGPTTTTPTTTMPTTAGEPLSNESLGWYYVAADPSGQDKPNTVPNDVSSMISKYNVIWQAPATSRKVVYLTMDNGYEYNNNTARILDVAKEKGVHITFFVIGTYIENNPDLVLRMVNEGHTVANHSFTHPDSVKLIAEKGDEAFLTDIHKLEDTFFSLTGQEMVKLYRTPSGIYSERLLDIMTRAGYRTVFWSFAYRDWLTDDQPDPAAAKTKILGQLHNGSIILLHAVSNTNTDIFADLVDEIRARGYEFGNLSEIP
jgi:peptidoglycan-N-acetylmuramic acid deacetylase